MHFANYGASVLLVHTLMDAGIKLNIYIYIGIYVCACAHKPTPTPAHQHTHTHKHTHTQPQEGKSATREGGIGQEVRGMAARARPAAKPATTTHAIAAMPATEPPYTRGSGAELYNKTPTSSGGVAATEQRVAALEQSAADADACHRNEALPDLKLVADINEKLLKIQEVLYMYV